LIGRGYRRCHVWVRSGVHVDIPRRARGSAKRAGDHSLRPAGAISIVVEDFRPNRTEARAMEGPRRFNGLWDDERVPLILRDVSSIGPKHRRRRPPVTLHGVVFNIFGREPKAASARRLWLAFWLFILGRYGHRATGRRIKIRQSLQ